MFNALESRTIIEYSITTKSDLHIGGVGSTAEGAVGSPVLKNPRGLPIIPGSSLKGVLRTELERLLKGLGIPDICTVPSVCGKPGTPNADKTCPVCQLFGGMNLAGSVRIHDAVTSSRQVVIRDHVAIDRKVRKAKDTAKFDLQAVVKGAVFNGNLVIENLDLWSPDGKKPYTQAKLGGFISLIAFFNACSGKIGGSVSRGYGEIEIKIDSIRILTAQDYLKGKYQGTPVTNNDSAIKAWQQYLTDLCPKPEDGVARAAV